MRGDRQGSQSVVVYVKRLPGAWSCWGWRCWGLEWWQYGCPGYVAGWLICGVRFCPVSGKCWRRLWNSKSIGVKLYQQWRWQPDPETATNCNGCQLIPETNLCQTSEVWKGLNWSRWISRSGVWQQYLSLCWASSTIGAPILWLGVIFCGGPARSL